MNITVNRLELLHAVKRAAAVAPPKSPVEVLQAVLLETDAAGTGLVLTATNLEVILKQKLPCTVREKGALAIDARLLAGMLEKLPGDTVELLRGDGETRLNIRSGEAQYDISVWEGKSYPRLDLPTVKGAVPVSGIPSMAKRTVFATDQGNGPKPMLKCVHLMFTQSGLRAAGSDGTCVVTAEGDNQCTGNFSVLIPAASLEQLSQMCDDKDEFRVGTDGKRVVFCREGFLFIARLIEETYIDTGSLVSSLKNQFTVLTDVADLKKSLASASCVDPAGKVRLSFEGMLLTFQCEGPYGSGCGTANVIPLTGVPQGEYWYLTKRLTACLQSLSGTATLGIAQGGMLTLSTENAFYMQTGVRPSELSKKTVGKKTKKAA